VPRKTPIALFAYNRATHLVNALVSPATCSRLDECDLFIFCDGAKSERDQDAGDETRMVARQGASQFRARLIERPDNIGLAKSIVSAVSDLCNEYGRCIVVEVDLYVNPRFIDYMLTALDRYEDDDRVHQVSGYMFPVQHPTTPDAFFLPLTTTWGWATWSRAWKVFDWEASEAREYLAVPEQRQRFDLDGSYPYSQMLEDRLAGRNDSWGILFVWAIFKAGGLALHPRESLVWNDGFDNSGTHCGDAEMSGQESPELVLSRDLRKSIIWPDSVSADAGAWRRIAEYLRKLQQSQNPTLARRILRRINMLALRP
jgi:hypothetical protein